jgi:hypothetical protein
MQAKTLERPWNNHVSRGGPDEDSIFRINDRTLRAEELAASMDDSRFGLERTNPGLAIVPDVHVGCDRDLRYVVV